MEENMNEKINVKKKGNALKYVLTFVGGAAIGAGALFGYNTFMDSKSIANNNELNNSFFIETLIFEITEAKVSCEHTSTILKIKSNGDKI